MSFDVIRNFGGDYIFFDIIFLVIFLFLLVRFKKKTPLIAFFVGGILINFVVDWGIWFHTGLREITLPAGFFWGLCFSFYGFQFLIELDMFIFF